MNLSSNFMNPSDMYKMSDSGFAGTSPVHDHKSTLSLSDDIGPTESIIFGGNTVNPQL